MSGPTPDELAVLQKLVAWYHATAKGETLPYPTVGDAEPPTGQLYRISRACNADALLNGSGVLTYGNKVTLASPRWRAMVGFPDPEEDARIAAMKENSKP
jgi:hypothetical protein